MTRETEDQGTEENATTDSGASTAGAGTGAGEHPKKNIEEKLDEYASRVSKSMAEGVKKMEAAFEKGMQNVRENPELSKTKIRGMFSSSTWGVILIGLGVLWLFHIAGILENPIFPIIAIVLGIYFVMRRKKS